MSEREGPQRERGATRAVRPEGRGPDRAEEREMSEPEAHGGGTVLLGLFGLTEEQTWQERALCAQTDPEAFFPEKGGSTREAKRICSTCEVRTECLEYALEHDERFGIWGGLSERERRRVKRRAV
jgi:WhiB family redox-sensing transcriptional regulator